MNELYFCSNVDFPIFLLDKSHIIPNRYFQHISCILRNGHLKSFCDLTCSEYLGHMPFKNTTNNKIYKYFLIDILENKKTKKVMKNEAAA